MRPGGGKAKGRAFERAIAKELSLWASYGRQADVFYPSAMSGGRATVLLKQGTRLSQQAGDISMIDPVGTRFIDRFSVECKHVANLELHKLFYGGTGGIVKFWEQALHDASQHCKNPFLVVKQNRLGILLGLSESVFYKAQISLSRPVIIREMGLVLMDYPHFLARTDPDEFLDWVGIPQSQPQKIKRVRILR